MPGDPVCDGIELALPPWSWRKTSVAGGEACLEFQPAAVPEADAAQCLSPCQTPSQILSPTLVWLAFCKWRQHHLLCPDLTTDNFKLKTKTFFTWSRGPHLSLLLHILTTMRSTNLYFTYLLTYLLTYVAGAVAKSAIHAAKCESCRQLLINSDATLEPLKSDATLNYSSSVFLDTIIIIIIINNVLI